MKPIFNTKEKRQKAYDLYHKQKLSLLEIANEFNCSEGAVTNLAHKDNWKLRRNMTSQLQKVKNVEEHSQEVINLYQNGWTINQISSKFGLKSRSAVRRVLQENKIEVYHSFIPTNENIKEIISLYVNDRLGINAIAKMYRSDSRTIIPILKSKGIKIRNQHEQNIEIGKRRQVGFRQDAMAYNEFRNISTIMSHLLWKTYRYFILPNNKKDLSIYSLDHIFSVCSAYKLFLKVPDLLMLLFVNHPANLQMISKEINSSKNRKSWYKFSELCFYIKEYNETYFCPYERCFKIACEDDPLYYKFISWIGYNPQYADLNYWKQKYKIIKDRG
jgi:predicted DNA-binding protein YlxM (UPF0122 family)